MKQKAVHQDTHAVLWGIAATLVLTCLIRIDTKAAKKPLNNVVLICAQRSPIWKLALSAIELADASYTVTFINQPCNIDTWLAITSKYSETDCIVFQEGV